MARTPNVIRNQHATWTNWHHNVEQKVGCLIDLWNPMPPQAATVTSDIAATADAVRSILADAVRQRQRVRAVGGTWSLSTAATSPDVMINTRPLNLRFPVAATSLDPASSAQASRIVYFQCGSSVQEVYSYLERRGLTLPTSGASNGQTIAGAVATGTHGSAFRYGAIQDAVVGIHLVTGPQPSDVILLERSERPVFGSALAGKLGARIVRNTAWFEAALVSFGSCGFVMGLVIEGAPLFLLESARRRVPFDDAVRHVMTTMDVAAVPRLMGIPMPVDDLVHWEVVFNPHDVGHCHMTTMVRRSASTPPSAAEPSPAMTPGDDLLAAVGVLSDLAGRVVPVATAALLAATYGDRGPMVATPGNTFTASTLRGKALSVELGVPAERSVEALALLTHEIPSVHHYAGVLAFRFVRRSAGTLAFTRFPVTCTIEIPGANSHATESYYRDVFDAFFRRGIPVTAHWGQITRFGPEIMRAYGSDADRWRRARTELLSAAMQEVFDHPILEACGLRGSPGTPSPAPIV